MKTQVGVTPVTSDAVLSVTCAVRCRAVRPSSVVRRPSCFAKCLSCGRRELPHAVECVQSAIRCTESLGGHPVTNAQVRAVSRTH